MQTLPRLPAVHRVGRLAGDHRWPIAGGLVAAAVVVAVTGVLGAAAAMAAVGVAIVFAWLIRGRDATALLSAAIAIAVVVPARFVVGPFGANGWPPLLLGAFFFCWWLAARLTPGLGGDARPNPVRYAIFALLAAALMAYANAFHGLLLPLQTTGADRVLFTFVAYFGFALLACDGIKDWDRLVVLLKRFVVAAAYLAVSVFLQFRQIYDLALLSFPGLVANDAAFSEIRSGFNRAPGTAAHPIEASVVLALALPLAITFLFNAEDLRHRRRWAFATALIGVALPMTVSRTGVLSIAVGMAVLLPTFPRAWRRKSLIAAALGVVALRIAIPGLVGTIRGLFLSVGVDTSVSARTDDYEPVFQMIYTHPWLGIGPGGFLPQLFFFLDNQILLTLLEMGGVGLVALIVTPIVAAGTARAARRTATDPFVRMVTQALAAAVLAGFASFVTFDALSFTTFGITWFMLIGCCGAALRVCRASADAEPASEGAHVDVQSRVQPSPDGRNGDGDSVLPVVLDGVENGRRQMAEGARA